MKKLYLYHFIITFFIFIFNFYIFYIDKTESSTPILTDFIVLLLICAFQFLSSLIIGLTNIIIFKDFDSQLKNIVITSIIFIINNIVIFLLIFENSNLLSIIPTSIFLGFWLFALQFGFIVISNTIKTIKNKIKNKKNKESLKK